MKDKKELLIQILLDPTARVDEKDDAVIDLRSYDDNEVLSALIQVASDSKSDEFYLDSCGESIAQIWIKRNIFPINIYAKLRPRARVGVIHYLEVFNPIWIKRYNLLNDTFTE